MISYIHSTTVAVDDQEAALDFYMNKLGWEKTMDNQMSPAMRWLTVVAPGAQTQIALAHTSWFGGNKKPGGPHRLQVPDRGAWGVQSNPSPGWGERIVR